MDINVPIENPELVSSMKELKNNYTQATERNFFKKLLEAKFLAPVIIDPAPVSKNEKTTLNKNTSISFIEIIDNEGSNFFPAFTDWEELRKWNQGEDLQTLIFTFKDYKEVILEREDEKSINGFVLNPLGQNVIFGKEQIQIVNNNAVQIDQDESVQIGVPKNYPTEMIEAVKSYLPKLSSVKSAYLMLMIRGKDDKSYLLVIDTDEDYNKVFENIAEVATKSLKPDEKIDFVPFNEEFGKSAVKDQDPFYRK